MKKRRFNRLGKVIIMDNEIINLEELLISMTITLTRCDKNLPELLQLNVIDMKYTLCHSEQKIPLML